MNASTTPVGAAAPERRNKPRAWRTGITVIVIALAAVAQWALLAGIDMVWGWGVGTSWAMLAVALMLLAPPLFVWGLCCLAWSRWGRARRSADVVAALMIIVLSLASLIIEVVLIVDAFVAGSKMAL